jgi:hypothetical protein
MFRKQIDSMISQLLLILPGDPILLVAITVFWTILRLMNKKAAEYV